MRRERFDIRRPWQLSSREQEAAELSSSYVREREMPSSSDVSWMDRRNLSDGSVVGVGTLSSVTFSTSSPSSLLYVGYPTEHGLAACVDGTTAVRCQSCFVLGFEPRRVCHEVPYATSHDWPIVSRRTGADLRDGRVRISV